MEKYEIVFSAELEADVNEFVRKWNADAECSKMATAMAEKATESKQFADPSVNDIIVFMTSVAGGVTANMLYDAIKEYFKEKGYLVSVKKDKWGRLSVDHLPLKKKK